VTTRFIDKYEIVSTLGRGSMGVVYKGKDPEIGRLVAIKTLKAVFMGDDPAGAEALQRFRQESRSAGKLHHPNIVTIFEAGKTESGSPYIVMEYIEGQSLETVISESGALSSLAVLHNLAQIGSAVDYAHSQSVIHRDIKPSNIIVDASHRPQLLDFGVAKLSDTSLTPAGTVVGTPSYMSPEQIRGATLDGRTDLFSLAVVAYESFTGVRPFPGNDFTTVVSNIIHKQPLSFSEVGADLPAELEAVIAKGLAKDRDDRFGTAMEFVAEMADIFGVAVDSSGLLGGYYEGITLDEAQTNSLSVSASGVVRAVSPDSSGRKSLTSGSPKKSANGLDKGHARVELPSTTTGEELDEATMMGPPPSTPQTTPEKKKSSLPLVIGAIGFCLVAGFGFLFLSGESADRGSDETAEVEVIELGGEENSQSSKTNDGETLGGDDSTPKSNTDSNDSAPDTKVTETAESPEEQARKRIASYRRKLSSVAKASREEKKAIDLEISKELKEFEDSELLLSVKAAGSDANVLRNLVLEAAGRGDVKIQNVLFDLLGDDSADVKAVVLRAYASHKSAITPRVIRASISSLEDEAYIVRAFAVNLLSIIETDEIRTVLRKRLDVEKHPVVIKLIKKELG
jgi:serine/threonine-protein kinase